MPDVGPTRPPIQWMSEAISLVISGQSMNLTGHLYLVHGVVLNLAQRLSYHSMKSAVL
jgi:hypothetical protein